MIPSMRQSHKACSSHMLQSDSQFPSASSAEQLCMSTSTLCWVTECRTCTLLFVNVFQIVLRLISNCLQNRQPMYLVSVCANVHGMLLCRSCQYVRLNGRTQMSSSSLLILTTCPCYKLASWELISGDITTLPLLRAM